MTRRKRRGLKYRAANHRKVNNDVWRLSTAKEADSRAAKLRKIDEKKAAAEGHQSSKS
jgi:hypothetical protein